ncbi:MAG: porin [Pseudomonadota bacterium]|nr:porin [Pseudomonadota bacterium]
MSRLYPGRPRLRAVAIAVLVAGFGSSGIARADATQDEIQALKAQVNSLMQKLEDLSRKQDANQAKTEKIEQKVETQPAAGAGASAVDAFLKGFYGTMDVSIDDTTKGIPSSQSVQGYNWTPGGGYLPNGAPVTKTSVGRVGWMPALSTNKSTLGYRGEHKIGDTGTKFVYQIETSLSITATPGLSTGYTAQGNSVKGAVGSGDTYAGFANGRWGSLKFGTSYTPYKKSTDRLNPFSGQLGDYAVIMGNTGGDSRVEFGTRQDHSLWYESPKFAGGASVDVLFSPGQNRTYDNVVQSAGSPDCNGGNMPGSGNLPLNCDDGGFSNSLSLALKYENGPFYGTMAFEQHQNVNRNSDGIGANNPIYGYYSGAGVPWIDNATQILPAGTTTTIPLGAYTTDIATEWAFKIGAQYKFDFGLTVSGILERMRRNVPAYLQYQNERSRDGGWLALTQELTVDDSVSFGWGHAGATPGDPGGQHNYNAINSNNTADMYTLAYKHKIDKALTWYVDGALTINRGNAHYDLGAGGRGVTTDCHDGTNTVFVDYSGAGPTTWGGCRIEGISTGVNYKF